MKNILLTGQPGAGKTLLIKRLADIFKEFNPQGFLTLQLRESGVTTGVAVISLSGESRILTPTGTKSRQGVSTSRIDMKSFEAFLANTFTKDKKTGLFFIDSIGKVESQSKKFCKLVIDLLNSDKPMIASIAEKGSLFIQEVRKRDDVRIVGITPGNHALIQKELTMEIRDLLLE